MAKNQSINNDEAPEQTPVDGAAPDAAPARRSCCKSCRVSAEGPRGKLHSYNWLADIPGGYAESNLVEVLFKNTRKGYYRNSTNIPLEIGDVVAVEASPGHDIGTVSMTGRLVALQMKKANVKADTELKRVFRRAKPSDLEKYREAKAREHDTMIRSRKIAESLHLNMKIGDVEYQGDGNKAIFYYIADERVDFRQLIKVLAETFKIRIEMKQIGARQEAGRIGGIGPCGRPLCCSAWMTNFVSVGTAAARFQDISLNPQKLAGQCAKLKCCLNFEVDTYVESARKMPPKDARLETVDGTWYHFKTDIFKKEITYSSDKSVAANLTTIDAARAFEIIAMNKAGEKPEALRREGDEKPVEAKEFGDIVGQDSLTRFDKAKKKRRKKSKGAGEGGKGGSADGEKSRQRGKADKADKPAGKRPAADNSESKPAEGEGAGRQRQRRQRQRGRKEGGGGGGEQRRRPDKPSGTADNRPPAAPRSNE